MQLENNQVKRDRVYQYVFLIAVTLFFPGMINSFGLLFEQGLTMGLLVVSLFFALSYKASINRNTLYLSFLLYSYFQIVIIISLIRSIDIIIVSDVFEIVKPFYLYLFFLLPFCFIKSINDLSIIVKYLMCFCLVLSVFGIIEAWTNVGYNLSTLLYKPDRGVLRNKAVASFIITYTFASFLVLPFYYFLTKFISTRGLLNKNLFFLFPTLLCIFSTQSKTIFLGLIVTTVLYFILYLFYRFTINKKKVLAVVSIITGSLILSISILITMLSTHFSYIYKGLEVVWVTLSERGIGEALYSTPSISLRLEQFQFALDAQDSIPLIGVAVGKAVLMPESLYALYLYRAGILGIIIHLTLLIYLFFSSKKCAKYFSEKNDIHMYSWFMAIHFYALSLPLSYFSSAVNDQTRTGFIFYFLIASTIYTKRKIYNNE
ncbi:TPA: hypothetical protein ACPJ2S_001931 [Vibrio alginolyticus]